jgi:signal transduction histidine kinase/CheY-like chemotaxis protein
MTPQFLLSTILFRVGKIFIRYETDVVRARNLGSLLAQEMQFDKTSSIRIGTAISELSRNMIEHSNGGTMEFIIAKSEEKTGFAAIFKDEGNGIIHIDEIRKGAYKSQSGMGIGLTGSQRLMDEFDIQTVVGSGTEITAAKWLPKFLPALTEARIEQITAAFAITIERGELSMVETINAQNKELLYLLKSIQERNDEIESINKELEETNRGVLALNRELQDNALIIENAKKIAEEANKAKSDFLAHMSHEIRTPMNAILGFTDLILKTELNKIQKQYTESIYIAGKALLNIINDILDLSKIEAGKLELEIVPVNLYELIDQVVEIMKVSANNKKLNLLLAEQPGLPQFIMADPVRLKQILLNLIGNAIKFTDKGFIEMKINFELVSESEYKITFYVIDTGIGISDDQKNKLFKAFSQADTSTTRKYGGTGLGLIISNLLAKKMNSAISFESVSGKGSTFHFNITTQVIEQTGPGPGEYYKRALIINHGPALNNLIRHLEFWNIDFSFSQSTVEFFVKPGQSEPDLIIVNQSDDKCLDCQDITARIIRSSREDKTADIVLISSKAEDARFRELEQSVKSVYKTTIPLNVNRLFYTLINKKDNSLSDNTTREMNPAEYCVLKEDVADKVILIAEDVELNMLLIKEILRSIIPGIKILEAVNGEEAIEIILQNNVDIVLMDVQMPVMDGLNATRKLREINNNQFATLPIIALTAGVLAEEKQRVYDSGMDAFLTKPIIENHLIEVLNKYL